MKHQLYFSLKDILKKKYIIMLLIIEMLFTLLFFSFTSTQVLIGLNQLKLCNKLKHMDIIYFSLYGSQCIYTNEIHELLVTQWNNNNSYSIIDFNSLDSYPEYNFIITLGAFDEVFGLNKLYNKKNNETICYIGSDVKNLELGNTINFGTLDKGSANIVARIPNTMSYILGERVADFKDTIVISTNIEYYNKLFYPLGIVDNTSFINPSDTFLNDYVRALKEANGQYIPSSLNQYAGSIKDSLIDDGLSAAILFLFVLIFVFISIAIIILQIINSNMKEYSIHILYGAGFKHIFLRTFCTISSIIAPTILVFNYFFIESLLEEKLSLLVLICVFLIVALTLSVLSLWKLKDLELENYFERNE